MKKLFYRMKLTSYMRIDLKKQNRIKISIQNFKLIFNALKKHQYVSLVFIFLLNDFFEKCLRVVSGGIIFNLNESFFCNTYFLSWM